MAVVQCPNGHSYDNSRHARCPYCTGSQTIGVTVPLGVQETDGTGGGPQNGGVNGGFPRTMPVQGQMPAPGGVGVTEPYQNVTKALEINEASSRFGTQIPALCRRVAELCAQENTRIMVNSDAHSAHSVGIYEKSIHMLEEIHFPEELIANRDLASLEAFLKE